MRFLLPLWAGGRLFEGGDTVLQTRQKGQSSTHSQSKSPVTPRDTGETLGVPAGFSVKLSLRGQGLSKRGGSGTQKSSPRDSPFSDYGDPSDPARPDAPSSPIPVDLCPAVPKEAAHGLFPVLVLILVPAGQQASCGKAAVRPPGAAPRARLGRKWG